MLESEIAHFDNNAVSSILYSYLMTSHVYLIALRGVRIVVFNKGSSDRSHSRLFFS
jgi:hypothetical protein